MKDELEHLAKIRGEKKQEERNKVLAAAKSNAGETTESGKKRGKLLKASENLSQIVPPIKMRLKE